MPMPKPKRGEDKDAFVERCMSDPVMKSEYEEESQRMAVCSAQFKTDEGSYTIDKVEVFAVGRWNGYKFTKEDLVSIANAFSNLRGFIKAPIKLGHNEDQPLKDGDFALGWIEDLWVDKDEQGKDKLFAKLTDLPKIVYDAIQKKLYRKVSIELDFGVEHKGRYYAYVLTGIALLGAQLPAVSTLNDIAHYLGREHLPTTPESHAVFSLSTVDGVIQQEEGTFMPLSEQEERELRDRLSKAESDAAKAVSEKAEFQRKAEEAEREKAAFEKAEQDRVAKEKADKVKFNREQVKTKLDKAVKEMQLTPAQSETYSKLLSVDDDEAMEKLDLSIVDKLIEDNKVNGAQFNKDKGAGGGEGDEQYDDAGDYLHEKTLEFMAKHDKVPYDKALERVMQMEGKAAAQHVNATTEHYEGEG